MKNKFIALALTAALTMSVGLAACGNDSDIDNGEPIALSYENYETVSNENYNKNLYYLNELKFEIADPSVIYITEGEEAGYFYAYGTSDLVNCYGVQCWRSKDLTNWEYVSIAYNPDFDNTWGLANHWAPEVLYEDGVYLMFYNADVEATRDGDNCVKAMSVVWSTNPYGPFEPFMGYETKPVYDFSATNSQISDSALCRSMAIDAHAFIDPVTGDRYLYYSGYGADGNGSWHGQTIFGIKMKNWLEPDYSTLKELTNLYRTTTSADAEEIDEGKDDGASVNEAPFMWYQDGTYYLTFSVWPYTSTHYQVRQAVASDPLGNFVKVQPDDGGQVLGTDSTWDNISSAGHHCFIACGDTLMIAYHTFLNRYDIIGGRALAVDTVSFVKNAAGQTLMHANGPTYSYQPLPEEISGYKNVASLATVTASNTAAGSSVDYLTDGALRIHDNDLVQEFETSGGNTVITLSFDNFVNVRSILVYNSTDYNKVFWGINSMTLQYKSGANSTNQTTVSNVPFDYTWHTDEWSTVYPGANSILEFDELPVNKITITILGNASDIRGINEIVVLGKETSDPQAVTESGEYSYEQPAEVSSLPVYESLTFGSAGNGTFLSGYGYDLSHDDGTENAYIEKTWCGNLQLLYFKDVVSTDFYVEAEISVGDYTTPYLGDEFPKIGIMTKTLSGYFIYYNIDCQATFSNNMVGYVESLPDGSDYYWNDYATHSVAVDGLSYTGDDYVKLAIARIGSKVYLFCNDQLVFEINGTLWGLTDKDSSASAVAFLSYNCHTIIKNYSITADLDEVKAKIASLGVTE